MLITVYLLASRDPVLVKKIGAATALEVRATGIPYVFAPCIAVSTSVSNISSKPDQLLRVIKVFLNVMDRFVEIQDGVDVLKAIVKIIRLFKQ